MLFHSMGSSLSLTIFKSGGVIFHLIQKLWFGRVCSIDYNCVAYAEVIMFVRYVCPLLVSQPTLYCVNRWHIFITRE